MFHVSPIFKRLGRPLIRQSDAGYTVNLYFWLWVALLAIGPAQQGPGEQTRRPPFIPIWGTAGVASGIRR